jgi:hypothetical protein
MLAPMLPGRPLVAAPPQKKQGPSPTDFANYQAAWVEAHNRTSTEFISEAIAQYGVVGVGEHHHDGASRNLVRDWINSAGSAKTALAVEVSSSDQKHLDDFTQKGEKPWPGTQWWWDQNEFQDMIKAAHAKGMPVIGVDADAATMKRAEDAAGSERETAEDYRDPVATQNVLNTKEQYESVLIFYGAFHLNKDSKLKLLGPRLDESISADFYAINAINSSMEGLNAGASPPVDPGRPEVDELLTILRSRDSAATQFAFPLAGSPIESATTPSQGTVLGDSFDGTIISIT